MVDADPLLLGSVAFLFTALAFIIARIVKLHYDEKKAAQRAATVLAMAEDEGRQARNERGAVGQFF